MVPGPVPRSASEPDLSSNMNVQFADFYKTDLSTFIPGSHSITDDLDALCSCCHMPDLDVRQSPRSWNTAAEENAVLIVYKVCPGVEIPQESNFAFSDKIDLVLSLGRLTHH